MTLVIGACVLAWSLSIAPGDPVFYVATALLAVVWIIGAVLARRQLGHPLHRVVAEGRNGRADVALGFGVGCALTVMFLVGALVLSHVPALRGPVETLLDHADQGIFVVVLVLTLVNGWAEEMFFRGAVFDAFKGRGPMLSVVGSTIVYTLVTAASGIWMLAFAGLLLGGVCALLRVRTGGTTASIVTHLTWSVGMIFLLPPALNTWS